MNLGKCGCGSPATRRYAGGPCCDRCFKWDKVYFDHGGMAGKMQTRMWRRLTALREAHKRKCEENDAERIFEYIHEATGGEGFFAVHLPRGNW